jgi:hypothetical protein
MTRSQREARPEAQPGADHGRRRVVVAAAAAAVAVAVAVPVALAQRDSEPAQAPPGTDGHATQPATQPATQGATRPARAALTADVAEDTKAPQVAYLASGDLVLPGGSRVPLDQDVSAVVPFGDRWLVAHRQDGREVLTVLAGNGATERSFPGGPSLAVSAGGVVATQDPDGQVVVGRPSDGRFVRLRTDMPLQDVQVVAMTGSGDCSARDKTCAVYYNEFGDLGGGFRMRPSGPVWEYTRFRSIVSVSPQGDVAGEVGSDGRRCTGVFDADEHRRWDTCDHALGDFSPDGRFVVGLRTGAAEGTVTAISILDARTGAVVADFAVDRETPVRVDDVVWETPAALLATVRTDRSWSLLRLTVDGGITKVSDLGAGSNERAPVRLQLTP